MGLGEQAQRDREPLHTPSQDRSPPAPAFYWAAETKLVQKLEASSTSLAPLPLSQKWEKFGPSSPNPAANERSQPQSKRETLGMPRPETERAAGNAPKCPKKGTAQTLGTTRALTQGCAIPRRGWSQGQELFPQGRAAWVSPGCFRLEKPSEILLSTP